MNFSPVAVPASYAVTLPFSLSNMALSLILSFLCFGWLLLLLLFLISFTLSSRLSCCFCFRFWFLCILSRPQQSLCKLHLLFRQRCKGNNLAESNVCNNFSIVYHSLVFLGCYFHGSFNSMLPECVALLGWCFHLKLSMDCFSQCPASAVMSL